MNNLRKESPPLKLALAGFSGAGKSTVLQRLARLLPTYQAFDLDQVLVDRFGPIANLVQQHGWEHFRQLERQELERIALLDGPWVLALGGGSLGAGAEVLRANGVSVIHLDCDFAACWERIKASAATRPLVTGGQERMAELFTERKKQFDQVPLRVAADSSPEEVALAILRLVGLAC